MTIHICTFEREFSPSFAPDAVPKWYRIPKLETEEMLEHASFKMKSDEFRQLLLAYMRSMYTPHIEAVAILYLPEAPRKWAQLLAYSEVREFHESRSPIKVVSGLQLERSCERSIVIYAEGPAYLELRQCPKTPVKLL